MWDVGIHILGIMAECACREAGGSGTRPYGGSRDGPVVRKGRTPAGPKMGGRKGHGAAGYRALWMLPAPHPPQWAHSVPPIRHIDGRLYKHEKGTGLGPAP